MKENYKKVLNEIYAFNQKAREKQPIFEKHLSLSQEERVLEFAITSRIEIQPNPLHEKLNKDIFTFVYLQELPLKKTLYSDNLEDFSYIKQYILRLLQLSPLNALHFTLIDPKTLGVSFNFLRPILDNEFIYNQRILTYQEEIEVALLDLANYMENLLQRQLCGVENYVEYNAKNPKPLPLKALVINGLGIKVFSSLALLCLRRLIKFSHLVGINIFIIIDNESLNKEKNEKGELFDCIQFLGEQGEKLGGLGDLSSLKYLSLKRVLEPEPIDKINAFLEEINTAYRQTSCIKGELKELLKEKDFLRIRFKPALGKNKMEILKKSQLKKGSDLGVLEELDTQNEESLINLISEQKKQISKNNSQSIMIKDISGDDFIIDYDLSIKEGDAFHLDYMGDLNTLKKTI
ncbi:hypothetical protein [Helicobacter pylori]|uniref:hypothetical protein n=1 Tax=Helicobacter pylori TaxID=210 RepID=UPI001E4F7CDC|nr:hypothetical protein [Helicobacter pylori]